MKKLLIIFAFFPLFLPAFSFSSIKNVVEGEGNVVVINSTETKAEGSNARTESSVSTTVNGEQVTVETNQPGLVEVKNINGKVEIKTSQGITPTIIITGIPNQSVKEEEEKQASFSDGKEVKISSFYSLFRRFVERFLRIFRLKTTRT